MELSGSGVDFTTTRAVNHNSNNACQADCHESSKVVRGSGNVELGADQSVSLLKSDDMNVNLFILLSVKRTTRWFGSCIVSTRRSRTDILNARTVR